MYLRLIDGRYSAASVPELIRGGLAMRRFLFSVVALSSLLTGTASFAGDYYGAPTTRSDEARAVSGYSAEPTVDPAQQTRSGEARAIGAELSQIRPEARAPRDPSRETRSDAAEAVVVPR
jgi:hypothetical protein